MTLKRVGALVCACAAVSACGRFGTAASAGPDLDRMVVISQQYNELIYALGAQAHLVGVDYSSTYPPEIKSVTTVGYHRALSAEGILSLKPTIVIHDNNIGPESVVRQLEQLKVPMKTFEAKDDSIDGLKALLREMGAFFHKETRAQELAATLDRDLAAARERAKAYRDHPRVAVIHFGRASNVYLLVAGKGGSGDGAAASQMLDWAGGEQAIQGNGMQRMTSPEIIAQANPDVILMTEFGFDRLGSLDQAKTLPGVAQTTAARTGRIYRVSEHELTYFNPETGKSVARLAELIHQSRP
ncbi:MAG TPA: ABC transporter substrate-binding protein [Vicinamibacterales bacterium]|nr:ABC transporter substrate-binding protein [Vicinamibacterales bacterium]